MRVMGAANWEGAEKGGQGVRRQEMTLDSDGSEAFPRSRVKVERKESMDR